MLRDKITEQVKEAMKERNEVRVSTLRLLANALHNEKIAKQRDLTEDEELTIIRREIKRREEAIDAYEKAGRAESAEREKQEEEILKEFLPAQMSKEEIEKIADELIYKLGVSGPQDFGKVMGQVMARVGNKADGKTVSEIIRKKLEQKT